MITATCQYTGFQFEAESKRTKNHPLVSAFLNNASNNKYQNGAYAQAKAILAQAQGQFVDIDSLMQFANTAYSEWCESGANAITVRSYREQLARDRRIASQFFRKDDGQIEELNDGVGGRYNAGGSR